MLTRKRQILCCIFLLTAFVLLTLGLGFHDTYVFPEEIDSTAFAMSEALIVKEVTIGGLAYDESGNLRQTYTGKPPAACPT